MQSDAYTYMKCFQSRFRYTRVHFGGTESKLQNIGTIHLKVVIKRTIFHEFHDNHDWFYLCNNTIQLDNIGVIESTHEGCLREEVSPLLG